MLTADNPLSASNFIIDKHVLTVQSFGEPLASTMNKYTRTNTQQDPNAPGTIVLLAHGLGFFKEIWEPIIEDIFRCDISKSCKLPIREIWALDCQNHGEASTLNEKLLKRLPNRMTIWDYAEAFAELYKSGLLGRLDPKEHQVVLCGHSIGAIAVVLATSFFNPSSRVPFQSLILVDPPIWSKRWRGKDNEFYQKVVQTTRERHDIWNSREEASKRLERTIARAWDKRIFSKYVEYGIRSLPTAFYPDRQGLTLTTHRLAESFCYGEPANLCVYEALDRLNQICMNLPVHLVYGNRNDMFNRELQNSLICAEDGRSFASIRRIDGAGHLIAQEKPTELAEEIFDILQNQGFKLPFKL